MTKFWGMGQDNVEGGGKAISGRRGGLGKVQESQRGWGTLSTMGCYLEARHQTQTAANPSTDWPLTAMLEAPDAGTSQDSVMHLFYGCKANVSPTPCSTGLRQPFPKHLMASRIYLLSVACGSRYYNIMLESTVGYIL